MSFLTIFTENPVFMRVLRHRMREAKSFWGLIMFILGACAVWTTMLSFTLASNSNISLYGYRSTTVGRDLFMALTIMEAFWISLFIPLTTSNAVTLEREKQTLETLQLTPLSPMKFMRGHLLSNLGYVALMLFSVLPLMSLSLILGGLSPREFILAAFLLLLGGAYTISVGLFSSAISKKTSQANGVAVLLVILSSFMLSSLFNIYRHSYGEWVVVCIIAPLVIGVLIWLMLSIAANKLYSSDQVSLNYGQALVLSIILLIAIQSMLWLSWNTKEAMSIIVFYFGIGLLILLDLGYYRPYSNFIQNIKNRSSIFRRFDDFMVGYFFILMGMLFAMIPALFQIETSSISTKINLIHQPIVSIPMIWLASVFWLMATGLLMQVILRKTGRSKIIRIITILILLVVGIGFPMVAVIIGAFFENIFSSVPILSVLQINPISELVVELFTDSQDNFWITSLAISMVYFIVSLILYFKGNRSHVSKPAID